MALWIPVIRFTDGQWTHSCDDGMRFYVGKEHPRIHPSAANVMKGWVVVEEAKVLPHDLASVGLVKF